MDAAASPTGDPASLGRAYGRASMVPDDVARRAEALRRDLHLHNHRYYVLDDPLISDAEYDALLRELQRLEFQFPELVVPGLPHPTGGRTAPGAVRQGPPRRAHAESGERHGRRGTGSSSRAACSGSWTPPSPSPTCASPSSTAWRWNSPTKRGGWCAVPPGATAGWGKTSPPTCVRWAACRWCSRETMCPRCSTCAVRSCCPWLRLRDSTGPRRSGGCPGSPTPATPPPARCASWTAG